MRILKGAISLKSTDERIGSMHLKRGSTWVWRYREKDEIGVVRLRSVSIGPKSDLPTEEHAWRTSVTLRKSKTERARGDTLGKVIRGFLADAMPLRHASKASYR